MCESSEKHVYSLVNQPVVGTTGTGFDQFVSDIFADPGLAGDTDSKDIIKGAQAAEQLNQLILKAADAVGARADGVFTVDEVTRMNAWLRANALQQWTDLHGDDEDNYESGYHYVQNDGSTVQYRGDNLLDTVIDGVYHMGFEICDGRFLNEDGDPNATVEQVAAWLTEFYAPDHSTTGTPLDRITDGIQGDEGLACNISDTQIAAGADAANQLNRILLNAVGATHVAEDGEITAADITTLANYIQGNGQLKADWARWHGADSKTAGESGFHQVKGDGSWQTLFGSKFVDKVAEGIYDIGFGVNADGKVVNEKGTAGASTAQVADWLNYFLGDPSTTGTGLDRIVDFIRQDRGLTECTSAADIKEGIRCADEMNKRIVGLVKDTGAMNDGWINPEDLVRMNAEIRNSPAMLKAWTDLHGDDEATYETGYHLIQNDGSDTEFFGENLVNTVADGIYHMCFEICDGRFLNEDGDLNQTLDDVASWLNFFYNNTTLIEGGGGDDKLVADERTAQINAGGGNDTVTGSQGNDLIYGDWGDDSIDGGAGNDLIYGGSGDDTLKGGDGNDVFRVTGCNSNTDCTFEGYDSYDGGAGKDSIVAYGGNVDIGFAAFSAASNVETIDATGATGTVRLLGDWQDNLLDFSSITLLGSNVVIDGGGGNDTIVGTANADSIEGGSWGDQKISGGGGNDTIHGGGGNDVLNGGEGDDVFKVTGFIAKKDSTFEGYDSYDGGAGKDSIVAYGGNVDIGFAAFSAASSVETIDATGATGTVRLLGDWHDNLLDFSGVSLKGSNFVINGGGGNDTIVGSQGNDVIDCPDWGEQKISGGSGNDTVHAGSGNDTVSGGDGDDVFKVTGSILKTNSTFEGYDKYDGGAGKDSIVAYGANVDIGLGSFSAANNVETIDARGATGTVRLLGDWQDSVLDFSSVSLLGSNIIINGGGGNDTITGSQGNDVIDCPDWGEQKISGGDGNDTIHAGSGNDAVSGGGGDDTFRVTGNKSSGFEGYDSYDGGAGSDRILAYGSNVDIGMTAFGPANGVEILDVSGATGAVRVIGDWQANTLDFSATAIVSGTPTAVATSRDSASPVTTTGIAASITIDGGGGNDRIIGSRANDKILGGDGDDFLSGFGGNDVLTGGNGADVFAFGASWGHDTVTDFKHGVDKLNFHDAGATGMANLTITTEGTNTRISFGGQDVLLTGIVSSKLTAADFVF